MHPRDPDELELEALRSIDPQPTDAAGTALTRRLGAAARSLTDEDLHADAPPPDLWDRIAGRVAADPHVSPAPTIGEVADEPLPRRRPVSALGRTPSGHGSGHRMRATWLVGAAAAVILAVVGAVALIGPGGDDTSTLASADLEVLTSAVPGTGVATASVVTSDGDRELDLALDIPSAPGFYEVWLIDANVEGMVSLGPVRSDGRYEIPAGVDIEAFPIVDVSIEPADGVPTHSGRSVLRGTLS